MDVLEFKDVQQKIALFGQLTEDLPIEKFLEEVDKASTLGPLLSPGICDCAWMENADDWAEIARKMLEFQTEWKRIKEAKK
jgi:hypothetical protein